MKAPGAVHEARHLAGRFVGSLRPGGPSPGDDAWARVQLLPGELELWDEMSGADRRHAIGVAKRVNGSLREKGVGPGRAVLAAALLHDVGKIESGLGTFGRTGATVVAALIGRRRLATWSNRPGWRGRYGRYVLHPDLGGLLLAGAGSDQITIAWATEHHRPPERWTIPADIGAALKAADND
jgi:hypothetical protein